MTGWALLTAVSLPFVLSANGQSPVGSVRGIVVNAKTHEPLKRATVFLVDRLVPGRRLGSLSDPNGQFVFADVSPGRYRLEAGKDGYIGSDSGGGARNTTILDVAAGQEIKDVVCSLSPAAALTGRVTDDLGDPAAGAQVHVFRALYSSGAPRLTPAAMEVTNDRGEFRVAGLARGSYYVKVSYRDPLQRSGAVKTSDQNYGYPAMFYPGVPDASQAAPLELHEGDEMTGVEIRLLRARTFAVTGTVLNSGDGQPAAHVGVSLSAKSAGGFATPDAVASAQTDEFGRFVFSDLAAGSYGVAAAASGSDGAALSARARVEVSEASGNSISLALRRGTPVQGVIQLEDAGTIQSAAAAQKAGWMPGLALFLWPTGDNPRMGAVTLRAKIQADGSFEVSDVPDDTYKVTFISLPEDYYVKSVRTANQDAMRSGFTSQGGFSDPLSIVLSSGGGRIDGVVANSKGEPASGAHVLVAIEGAGNAPASFNRQSIANQNGRFSIRGLAPGSYQLIALENVEDGEYDSPSFFARYAKSSKKVTVEENGRLSVILDLSSQE